MEWTQLRVNGTLGDRDTICAVMCMLDSGLMIEDYSDIDMDTVYADLIDEEILKKDKNRISVSFFVPPQRSAVPKRGSSLPRGIRPANSFPPSVAICSPPKFT